MSNAGYFLFPSGQLVIYGFLRDARDREACESPMST